MNKSEPEFGGLDVKLNGRNLYRTEGFFNFNEIKWITNFRRVINVKADSIFVPRFFPQLLRAITLLILVTGISMMYFSDAFSTKRGSIYDGYRWVFDFDQRSLEEFEGFSKAKYEDADHNLLVNSRKLWKEWKLGHFDFYSNIFMLGLFVTPFLVSILIKPRAPVVFDKERRLIYTNFKGRLFYAYVDDLSELPFRSATDNMDPNSLMSPLTVILNDSVEASDEKIDPCFNVGVFFEIASCQQQLLSIIITAYFSDQNRDTDDEWLHALLERKPAFYMVVLDFLFQFSLRRKIDMYSPEIQAELEDIIAKREPASESDMDFEDFDFSYRKPVGTQ
ncbi:hypothetical protein [Neptunomonas sp.]|uniref:hypothetical protein n=1 Tax=Neptunomonas TaxID=75687 RepID=UPI0035143561